MPSISVVVPVYKVEPYIRRCVDSILGQSYTDFELILVDDGSPDSCGDICEEYARRDSRIHVIHQENGGLSAARNTGIDWAFANSDSRWLTFVDSDDWVHQEYLRLLFEAAERTQCRISACGFYRTGGEALPEEAEPEPVCLSADDFYCGSDIPTGVPTVAWGKLYHKSLFESLRYPEGKLHEDEFTTYLALYEAGKVGVTTACLYAYYQNPAGIMLSQWNPRRMHILEAFEQQIAFAQKKENPRLLRVAVEQYIYGIHEQLAQAQNSPEHKPYQKVLQKKLRAALRLGKSCGAFPRSWENLWAYEEAYPMKPVWWILCKVRPSAQK